MTKASSSLCAVGVLLLHLGGCPGDVEPPPAPQVVATRPARVLAPPPAPAPAPALTLAFTPGTAIPDEERLRAGPERPITFPVRCAISADGVLYIADIGASAVFGLRGGERIFQLTRPERPLGLAVHGDRLLVGDDARGIVEAYSRTDHQLLFALGSGPGEFEMPNAIAVSPDGARIFVADSKVGRIKIYDSAGRGVDAFDGGADPLRFPVALTADEERLAVADQGNHRVQLFDHQGGLLRSMGSMPPDNANNLHQLRGRLVRPQAVAFLGGTVAVLDSAFGTVQLFDPQGASAGFLGGRGGCSTCVDLALDIAFDPAAGDLVVLDPNRRRWVRVPNAPRARP